MKLAILMDPLHKLKPKKDSTIAMIQAANSLGWSCVYFTLADLFCRQGKVFASVIQIQVLDHLSDNWAQVISLGIKELTDFDIILIRKDPPFDLEYIYATYMLELAERAGVLVANKPQGLRAANEKLFTQQFPHCCPETLVSQDIKLLHAFWQQYKSVIYKPLDGMGGQSIFYVGEDGMNLSVILETLTKTQSVTIMAQKYIPEIMTSGDKRIILLNGEPVAYGLSRRPCAGELRGNLAAGGNGEVTALTDHEYWICAEIAPRLKQMGLYFVGIDVIGDFLTEINVTSPTCIREISLEIQQDIALDYLQVLQNLTKNHCVDLK